MWQLLDNCNKFYREFGNKDFYTAVQPPRALTPTPTTRSRRPSFTVADHPVKSQDDNLHKVDASGVSESGEGKGGNVDGGGNNAATSVVFISIWNQLRPDSTKYSCLRRALGSIWLFLISKTKVTIN